MSRPRWFKNVDDLLDAARSWGFQVKHAHTGHWQIWERREGFGPSRLLATFSGTGTAIHGVIAKSNVAKIKRETGIDIRREPPRRVVERHQAHSIPEMVVRLPEPELKPEPPKLTTYSRDEIKTLVREAIVDAILELARKLAPPEASSAPPARCSGDGWCEAHLVTHGTSAAAETPSPASTEPQPASPARRHRARNLTPEQTREIVALYRDGEPFGEIARTYGIADSTISSIVARLGIEKRPRLKRASKRKEVEL